MTRKTKKILFGAGSAFVLAVGAIGAAHVPAVRAAFGVTGCPWDPSNVASTRELEEQRAQNAAALRGNAPAKARPAFGFTLAKTTKADVAEWTKQNGFTCRDTQRNLALDCESDPRDVFFRFDTKDVLVEIDVIHAPVSPEEAAPQLASAVATVTAAAGEPATKRGEATAAHLSAGSWSQATYEFRFADYAADLSAMTRNAVNGGYGVVVRERYRALDVAGREERHASR